MINAVDVPDHTRTQPVGEQAVLDRAIVLVKRASELDTLETEILSQRLGDGQEAAEAYLYVIEQGNGRKPIVGASVDFVRQAVRVMNASGSVRLSVAATPPVVEEITIDGRPHVRVLVQSIDDLTGEIKWVLKEEARETIKDGQKRRNPHAATIALEKAERKALESHPSYNRKLVNKIIKTFLRRAGLDPAQFQIGTGSSAWADIFGRARAKAIPAGTVRETARQSGKSLSEAKTADEVKAAVHATDQAIPGVVSAAGEVDADRSPEDVATVNELRSRAVEIIEQMRLNKHDQVRIWQSVGSAQKTMDDYRRLHFVVNLLSVGVELADAEAQALKKWPRAVGAA